MTRAAITDRPAFTPASLAARWGVSVGHIYSLIRKREIRSFNVGRGVRVSADEVARIEGSQAEPGGNSHLEFTNPWGRA